MSEFDVSPTALGIRKLYFLVYNRPAPKYSLGSSDLSWRSVPLAFPSFRSSLLRELSLVVFLLPPSHALSLTLSL